MQSDCRVNLHQAEQAILDNQLDTIFPEFAIRKSSYYRVFGFPDSAITYAQRALETAVELKQQEQTSVAHLLLGMLKRKTPEEALLHFQECIRIYTELQDYTGCIYAYVNSLKCYQRLERYEEALLYSDSAVLAIPIAVKNGNDAFTWGRVYKARAEVFYALGQMDSAWYNINKASTLDLEFERRNNAQQVAEIDAKYNDEQKAQRLEEQEQVIKFERQRRIFLTILMVLFLGFSAILTFYYLRLRSANRKTVQQAATITKKNEDLSRSLEEQIILQSEVHHRVKNNLQVIISLLEIQKDDLQDPNAIQNLDAMANRIYSMAAIHEILYQHNGVARIDFIEYTQRLCRHLANLSPDGSYPRFDLQIDDIFFNLETSIPLGIMLTELLTNSLKYARLPDRDLLINIELQPFEDHYRMVYRDNGPGLPEGGIRQREGGLGTYLLRSMARQLRGKLSSRTEGGAVFEVEFYEKNKLTDIEINPQEIKQGASTEQWHSSYERAQKKL